MANIKTTRLYRTTSEIVIWPEYGPPKTLPQGEILWLHGSRPSSMGGYIGTFSKTYQQAFGYSPTGYEFTLKMDQTKPIY